MGAIRTILHPTDFSESANNAFHWACSLTKANNARLLILHTMLPSSDPFSTIPLPDPLRSAESQPDLNGAFPWPKPLQSDVIVEHRVAEGDAATTILQLAEAIECDVIVMGTHGRTGLKRLLTGSVAEEVMRKATCPVLVVRDALGENPRARIPLPEKAGEVVDIHPSGQPEYRSIHSTSLILVEELEVLRLEIPAGQDVQNPPRARETVIHVVEGRIALSFQGRSESLDAGQLICIAGHMPFLIKALQNSLLVLTVTKYITTQLDPTL